MSGPFLKFASSLLIALLLEFIPLPQLIEPARPMLIPMVLCYWTLYEPRMPTPLAAFLCGLLLDAAYGAPIGQYGLGLLLSVLLSYHLRGIFGFLPIWQGTLILGVIWSVYAALMFWIDGVTGHSFDPWSRWMPIASTVVLWPVVAAILNHLRRRRRDAD